MILTANGQLWENAPAKTCKIYEGLAEIMGRRGLLDVKEVVDREIFWKRDRLEKLQKLLIELNILHQTGGQ